MSDDMPDPKAAKADPQPDAQPEPQADLSLTFTVSPGQWIVRPDRVYRPGEQVTFSQAELDNLTVSDLISRGIIA